VFRETTGWRWSCNVAKTLRSTAPLDVIEGDYLPAIAHRLGARALGSGEFLEPENADNALATWWRYRDQVIGHPADCPLCPNGRQAGDAHLRRRNRSVRRCLFSSFVAAAQDERGHYAEDAGPEQDSRRLVRRRRPSRPR
jgi:hypothetical protein